MLTSFLLQSLLIRCHFSYQTFFVQPYFFPFIICFFFSATIVCNIRRKEQCLKDGKVGLGLASVDYPKSMQKNRMTLDELERAIQIRIMSRAPRPQVQFMTAYKMFGSPKIVYICPCIKGLHNIKISKT